jgi:hypothetical protein
MKLPAPAMKSKLPGLAVDGLAVVRLTNDHLTAGSTKLVGDQELSLASGVGTLAVIGLVLPARAAFSALLSHLLSFSRTLNAASEAADGGTAYGRAGGLLEYTRLRIGR